MAARRLSCLGTGIPWPFLDFTFGEIYDSLLGPELVAFLRGEPHIDENRPRTICNQRVHLPALSGGSRQQQASAASRHVKALGDDYDRLKGAGTVEVGTGGTNPATDRSAAISNERRAGLNAEYLPIAVTGDPVQDQVYRTPQGWAVELVNNRGVVKQPDQPAIVDPNGLARIRLRPRVPIRSACQWMTDGDAELSPAPTLPVTIGPGETVFVELVAD